MASQSYVIYLTPLIPLSFKGEGGGLVLKELRPFNLPPLRSFISITSILCLNRKREIGGVAPKYNSRVGGGKETAK